YPVGYYDLSIAGVPVHSTAFRPATDESLRKNPFRVFTSLIRLDQITDNELRKKAEVLLNQRNIFSKKLQDLLETLANKKVITQQQADEFVEEATNIFKWYKDATVTKEVYESLQKILPLIADVVCFKGPHINHLTPRTL